MNERRPRRMPDIPIETSSDTLLVHNPRTEKVHVLNAAAGFVLERCDGERTVEQLAHELARESSVSADLRKDVERIISEFVALGLVDVAMSAQA